MLNNKLFLSLSLLTISNLAFMLDLSPNPKSPGTIFEASLAGCDEEKILECQRLMWTNCVNKYMSGTNFPGLSSILVDRTHDYLLLHNCFLYCDINLALNLYNFMKEQAEKLSYLEQFRSYIKLQNSNGLNALHCVASRKDDKEILIKNILELVPELIDCITVDNDAQEPTTATETQPQSDSSATGSCSIL